MKKLSVLLILMACNSIQQKAEVSNQPINEENPCGIPNGVNFDTRLVEVHEYDSSHCVAGQSCAFSDVNTHRQLLKFDANFEIDQTFLNKSGLKIKLTDSVAIPEYGYDAAISNPMEFNCYMNGDGPYGCGGANYISFPTNADLLVFREKCGI